MTARTTKFRIVLLLCFGLAVTACKESTAPQTRQRPTNTFLSIVSEPGDYVGQAESRRHSLADGSWTAQFDTLFNGAGHVTIGVNTAVDDYTLHLSAPAHQPLTIGRYVTAKRWPFNGSESGLAFSTGRGCNELSGRFIIHELVVAPDNTVAFLHAEFEQHCENALPALKGEIAVVANPWR